MSLTCLKMNGSPEFPNDENGDVLRRMYAVGDDLTKPRMIEFCFVFPERTQALVFAEHVDDRDVEICISFFLEREMWQAIVKRHMVPEHEAISSLEARLASIANKVGGSADGWGCMKVPRQTTL